METLDLSGCIAPAELELIAVSSAKKGAEVIQEALDKPRAITFKGSTDIVPETDVAAEQAILACLQGQVPDHMVLGEEGGVSVNADSGSPYLWCVDPLDGTTNFAAGYPSIAVSVRIIPSSQSRLVGGFGHDLVQPYWLTVFLCIFV